jgi:predicted TIM-barrel fold metal-dependent hydrolase
MFFYFETSREEARAAFDAFLNSAAGEGSERMDITPLENFMMHHCLSIAEEREMTYQFHTGIQEGHGNKLGNSDPELMCNLFLKYPGVTFDVFHIGYPYQNKLCALAKMFPNVIIDMAWANIISPEACVRGLVEWLDAVPANKICGFGGDYLFPDGVVGHAAIARENVSRALAEKVDRGIFDLDRGKEIASMLFVDTPKRIFSL